MNEYGLLVYFSFPAYNAKANRIDDEQKGRGVLLRGAACCVVMRDGYRLMQSGVVWCGR